MAHDLTGWPSPVTPHRGWTLHEFDERDGDGFYTPTFFARGPVDDVLLNVSRFTFRPNDARFRWLVDNDFGRHHGRGGSLSADEIDRLIALQTCEGLAA